MLSKIRPQMFDDDWVKANKLLLEFRKKSYKTDKRKEEHFVYLVNKIFKALEENGDREQTYIKG